MNKNTTLKLLAPAKVNLFLAIGNKIPNSDKSYHEVLNIMHTLLLHDILYIESEPSKNGLEIHVEFLENANSVNVPNIKQEDNIVYKAIKELSSIMHTNPNQKISVYIEKNIPHQAGLGGGSSDAAATLVGFAHLWKLSKDDARIIKAAENIGADVSFFLKGGCALYSGAGEIYENSISPINRDIVIVRPKKKNTELNNQENSNICGLSTQAVYKAFDTMPNLAADIHTPFSYSESVAYKHDDCCNHDHHNYKNPENSTMNLYTAVKSVIHADNLPLFNNLAPAAESLMPELTVIRQLLSDIVNEKNVLLCGSGSAIFAIIPDSIDADKLANRIREKGLWACSTQLANTKAKLLPKIC